MIKNARTKRKSQRRKTDINKSNDSGRVQPISSVSGKKQPIGMICCSYEIFPFAIQSAGDFANFGPRWLLDEYDVELGKSLQ